MLLKEYGKTAAGIAVRECDAKWIPWVILIGISSATVGYLYGRDKSELSVEEKILIMEYRLSKVKEEINNG